MLMLSREDPHTTQQRPRIGAVSVLERGFSPVSSCWMLLSEEGVLIHVNSHVHLNVVDVDVDADVDVRVDVSVDKDADGIVDVDVLAFYAHIGICKLYI